MMDGRVPARAGVRRLRDGATRRRDAQRIDRAVRGNKSIATALVDAAARGRGDARSTSRCAERDHPATVAPLPFYRRRNESAG